MTKVYNIYEVRYRGVDLALEFHSVAETLEDAEARIATLLHASYKQYTILTVYAY